MVLVDFQIREGLEKGYIKVTPFNEDLINPASLDFRLSGFFSRLEMNGNYIDPRDKETYRTVELGEIEELLLEPGKSVLGSSLEVIELAGNIAAQVIGKSSLARLFLDNSSLGGYIDPGFKGTIVLELVNHSGFPILLRKNMKIGQFVFLEGEFADIPYNEKVGSKYMNQNFAQGSKYWKNG